MPPSPRRRVPAGPPGLPPACPAPDPSPRCLSPRQRLVVLALCEGLDRHDVARRLRRSRSTCDKAICAIYRATGFGAAHQVVAWAFRTGLAPAGPVRPDRRP